MASAQASHFTGSVTLAAMSFGELRETGGDAIIRACKNDGSVISIAAVLLLIAAAMIVNPAARTKYYFAVERQWAARWPLTRGAALPTRFMWLVRPTEPAWVEVEPRVTMLLDPEDYVSREILRTGTWEAAKLGRHPVAPVGRRGVRRCRRAHRLLLAQGRPRRRRGGPGHRRRTEPADGPRARGQHQGERRDGHQPAAGRLLGCRIDAGSVLVAAGQHRTDVALQGQTRRRAAGP